MFKKCNHLLWAITVCLIGLTANAWAAGVSGLMPESISDSVSSQKFAGLTFLPDYQDGDFGWNTNTIPRGSGTTDECAGYTLSVCPDHGNCSKCLLKPLYKLDSCNSGWSKSGNACYAASCDAIGYKAEIPVNNLCTRVSENGLTCYKDCRSISCSGYSINCDNFNVANSTGKEVCADCNNANANCSPKLCKVGSCADGFKIAENGTACIALDDNCPVDYYKECETGTEGEPQYTELGTACYKCKAKVEPVILPILYSDLTTSTEVISGKTPIGIVFDEEKKLAVALSESPKTQWSATTFDIARLTNFTTNTEAVTDWDGKGNTEKILDYCPIRGVSCPAAEFAYNFSTSGAETGNWYLPSAGELNAVYNKKDAINTLLAKIGGTALGTSYYWTSTEIAAAAAWHQSFSNGGVTNRYAKTSLAPSVRPIINYGDVQKPLPILYSDLTTSTEIISGKTPIGIVFDETKKLAVAANAILKSWSTTKFDIPNLANIATESDAMADLNGRANTKSIFDYCKANSLSCPAAEYAYKYTTTGTRAGDWYLPAMGELNAIRNKRIAINVALTKIGVSTLFPSTFWSSSESGETTAWRQDISTSKTTSNSKTISEYVLPVIKYGDTQFPLPVLYSDLTTSLRLEPNKTPIGIVFDESKKLAVALDQSKKQWATTKFRVPGIPYIGPGRWEEAQKDWNGKKYTTLIINYCKMNAKSCPAAEYANSYSTLGTKPGDWYLPAIGELHAIYTARKDIHEIMDTIGGTRFWDDYWSSNEDNDFTVWIEAFNFDYTFMASDSTKTNILNVRPVINYGDVKQSCTPLKNDNECPDWRQYPCDDGCGGRRKCCGPYYGYKYVSCTHWVAMCKQSEVKEAQEVCKMTWLDPCDMFGTSSPDCSQDEYYNCLDEVEFNQCLEVVPDSSSDFIYTAPPGCMN